MLMGKEDLGLSLSLGSMENHRQRFPPPQKFDLLAASSQGWEYPEEAAAAATARDIDVNRTPPSASAERESEEEAVASSPKSGISDEEDGDGSRKKLRLSKDQSAILEESFKEHSTLNPKQKLALAKQLNLRPRQVEVWFQNRRARTKLKQTEVDCEFLKRCCESLTEENRRLQKEVAELRALKLSPQLYMHMTPPTTLTMCPSCERVATTSAPPPDHHHHHQRSFAAPAPWFPMTPKTTSFM